MARTNRGRSDRRESYRPAAPRRHAPTPTGYHVATFDRPGYRRDDENQQLRVIVDAMEGGRAYASIRVWKQDRVTGEWWPTHSGITVRQNEGDDVLAALVHALDLARDPATVARIHAHNERIGKDEAAPSPPALATGSARPSLNTDQTMDHRSANGAPAPWDGPDQFADPKVVPPPDAGRPSD